MIPEWMNHIELVVLASLVILIVSSFVNSLVGCCVQLWILKKDCTDCGPTRAIPEIVNKQSVLREQTLKTLEVNIETIKGDLKGIRALLEQAKIHYQESDK